MEADAGKAGYTPGCDIEHSSLLKVGESIADLMAQLATMEATLQGFKSLPPVCWPA